jgi:protein arginine kinase
MEIHWDGALEWLEASGPNADIVLSTRVRLARNLQGQRFGPRATTEDRDLVLARLRETLKGPGLLGGGRLLPVAEMSPSERRLLLERHWVSRELVGEGDGPVAAESALMVAAEQPLAVMINEEDHLRLQALLSGFRLQEAWRLVDALDEELGRQIPFAFHPEFGYLTSCPTNVGTGLRASVLMHLPGLVLTQEVAKVLQGIAQVGLTFRGLYGEGSEVIGNFFQISNQTTLGKTEEDLIDHLHKIVQTVIQYEAQARSVLCRDAPGVIEDKVWRAYGLLRFARSLSFDEVMNLLSGVRLGVSLKLLDMPSVFTLNQIMIFAQSAHLEAMAGRELSEEESDTYRAAYVRRMLAEAGDPSDGGTSGGQ